jgi:hypothetical protein
MQVLVYSASKTVPFHSAIIQSTALEPGMSSDISFNVTAAIGVIAGCLDNSSSSDFDPCSPSQSLSVIFCLRSLSIESLLNFADAFITQTSAVNDGDVFLPVTDQDFLSSLPSSLLSSVKFPKMPLIIR